MLPTLADGDRLLVRGGTAGPARAREGRLAVVRLPGGRPLGVKRLLRAEPEGWWVERDNPAEGVDSWHVGAIPDGDVVAVVVARVWPRPARL
jgi:phage repressor protein C with HTH and peptisase S24 domain